MIKELILPLDKDNEIKFKIEYDKITLSIIKIIYVTPLVRGKKLNKKLHDIVDPIIMNGTKYFDDYLKAEFIKERKSKLLKIYEQE